MQMMISASRAASPFPYRQAALIISLACSRRQSDIDDVIFEAGFDDARPLTIYVIYARTRHLKYYHDDFLEHAKRPLPMIFAHG